MTIIDNARPRGGIGVLACRVARRLGDPVRALARERAFRRAAAQLERLDDRLLAAIGLSRDHVAEAVRTGRTPDL